MNCDDALNCAYNGRPTIGCSVRHRAISENCSRSEVKTRRIGLRYHAECPRCGHLEDEHGKPLGREIDLVHEESDGEQYVEIWYCPDCDTFYTEEYEWSHWEVLDESHAMMDYAQIHIDMWLQLKRLEDLEEC